MRQGISKKQSKPLLLIGLIILQSFCAIFFMVDVVQDFNELGTKAISQLPLYFEALASLALGLGILIEAQIVRQILRSNVNLKTNLELSRQSLHEVVVKFFEYWKLTPAEFDVAMFLFKGLSVSEISDIRGTSVGTTKAQLSAIYRKADVQNRSELLTCIIEEVFSYQPTNKTD